MSGYRQKQVVSTLAHRPRSVSVAEKSVALARLRSRKALSGHTPVDPVESINAILNVDAPWWHANNLWQRVLSLFALQGKRGSSPFLFILNTESKKAAPVSQCRRSVMFP